MSSKHRRLCIIAILSTIAGIINGVVIFNLTHQFGYAEKVIPAIMAMSETDKNIIVSSEQDYKNFSSYTSSCASDYSVYLSDSFPDSIERTWFIFSSDSPEKSKDPNDLISGFHVVSEIIADDYSAYELEKL